MPHPSDARSITYADDARIVAMIRGAKHRVVYVAPGASEAIAAALDAAWSRIGPDAVQVIVDIDPEVCRLGYGTLEALKALREAASRAGALVCEQPGIRIGLLITDEATLIYSPTPLLIEAGSDRPERPNAIVLTSVPEPLGLDVGLGNPGDQRVGLDAVKPHRIDAVEADLAAAPPLRFDLARQVRVFTSRFQFVELKMPGCSVSRKKVPIPSNLMGLAGEEDIERQFHAQFDLVQKGRLEVKHEGRTITERLLLDRRRDIEKRFLVTLAGYGTVVLRSNKDRFVEAVEKLKAEVKVFSNGLTDQLAEHIEIGRKALAEALLPAVERNPPDAYTKTLGPKPPKSALRALLNEDIADAFGTAGELVDQMEVTLIFKDVAYESLVDPKFIEVARKAMPHVEFLHEEYNAAAPAREEEAE